MTECAHNTIAQEVSGERQRRTECAQIVNIAKQAIHDKLETQIKTAEAKLDMVKAQAESAKADAEIKA